MVQPISLATLYRFSPRPFFFSFKSRRRISRSARIFAYDYDDIGRFYYVILDLGLEDKVLYKVPDFLKVRKFFAPGFSRRLRFTPEHAFLVKQSFFFEELFSSKFIGYFPLTFFNSYMLASGWSRSSLDLQSLAFEKVWTVGKGGIGGVKSTVDTHLSIFFAISERARFFPRSNNFIANFSSMVPKVYLILGEHNIPVYIYDSNMTNASVVSKKLQLFYARSHFFKKFFRGLKTLFLQQFFTFRSSSVVTPVSLVHLSVFFSYYRKIAVKALFFFSYIKLYLSASVFCFFYGSVPSLFLTLRFFLGEFLNCLFSSNQGKFLLGVSSFVRRRFFRSFVYKILRFLFVSDYSLIASSLLDKLSFNINIEQDKNFKPNAYLFNDITFLKGASLSLGLRFSRSYRQFVSRSNFKKIKVPSVLCRKRRVFVPRKARRRWVNRLHGYYSRKRRSSWFRWLFVHALWCRRLNSVLSLVRRSSSLRSNNEHLFRNGVFRWPGLSRRQRRTIAFFRRLLSEQGVPLPEPSPSSGKEMFSLFLTRAFFIGPPFRTLKGVCSADLRLPLALLELHSYKTQEADKIKWERFLRNLWLRRQGNFVNKRRVSFKKGKPVDDISTYRPYQPQHEFPSEPRTQSSVSDFNLNIRSPFFLWFKLVVRVEKYRRWAEIRERRLRARVATLRARENVDEEDDEETDGEEVSEEDVAKMILGPSFVSDPLEASEGVENAVEVEPWLYDNPLIGSSYGQAKGLSFKSKLGSPVKVVYLTRRLVYFLAFFFGIPKGALGRPYSGKFFRFRFSSFMKLRKLLLRRRGFELKPFCARKRLVFEGAQGASFSFGLRRLYRSYIRRPSAANLKNKKRSKAKKIKNKIFFNKRNFSKLYSFCFFFEPCGLPTQFYIKDLSMSLNVLFLNLLASWLRPYGIFQRDFMSISYTFLSVSGYVDSLKPFRFLFFYRRFFLVRSFVSYLISFLRSRHFNDFRFLRSFFRYLCVFFKFRRLRLFRQRKVKVVVPRHTHKRKRRRSFNFKRFHRFGKSSFRRNR